MNGPDITSGVAQMMFPYFLGFVVLVVLLMLGSFFLGAYLV